MSATLDDLEEFVQYSVTIRAYTIIGPGNYSLPVLQATPEDGTL